MAALALVSLSVGAWAAPIPSPDLREWERFSVLTPAGPEEPSPDTFQKIKRLVWAEHKVQRGEYSAALLAKRYRTTVASLQATNRDELYIFGPGRKLVVLNQSGLLYQVRKDAETLDQVVAHYERDPGRARKLKEWVVRANLLPGSALLGEFDLEKGERVLLPGIRMVWDTFHYPVSRITRISSRFGTRRHPIYKQRLMHVGLDIPKPYGTPVFPARSGVVVETGWRGGYGMLVVIRHAGGWTTRYGHLS
ncbi:MAG: M23 family metallopeptidase, partial [Elusimicrobia bacterium]|nr:M23 family metallopeptidase [Elusimicrobiota bacterium]